MEQLKIGLISLILHLIHCYLLGNPLFHVEQFNKKVNFDIVSSTWNNGFQRLSKVNLALKGACFTRKINFSTTLDYIFQPILSN